MASEDDEDNFLDPSYWSSFYGEDDEQFDWYSAPGLAYATALREIRRDSFVLDVGCGTASHLTALARRTNVVGIDFSERVVELAKEFDETKKVSFVCGDARRLPFASRSFDVVLDKGCLDCFVSTPNASARDRDDYLREIHRVLKPNGVYVLCAVCGVDVVTLLHTGIAVKHSDSVIGASRAPEAEWEVARSGDDNKLFPVTQIVSFQNKHVYRAVKRRRGDNDSSSSVSEEKQHSSTLERRSCDEDLAFDDAPTDSLSLDDGFFCGSCGRRIVEANFSFPLSASILVPEECESCSAPLRRFALS